MVEKIDLRPADKALSNASGLLNSIQEANFSWPDKKAFEADFATASTLLAEMQQSLSTLIVQLPERSDIVHEQGLESEVSEAVHKSYNLLSKLYDDLHAIKDDGPVGSVKNDTFKQAKIHFQQITSHYTATRDRLDELEQVLVTTK